MSGFTISETHKNWHIPVDNEFVQHLHKSAERRLQKAKRAGFRPGLPKGFSTGHAYDFLEKCRAQKGYPLSISRTQFEALINRYPEKTQFFGLLDDAKLVAFSFVIRPTAQVVYNFLSDYEEKYRAYSPVILLTSHIYEVCHQNGVNILDLGISLDHFGNFKPSLAKFKEHIGGLVTEKFTYRIEL